MASLLSYTDFVDDRQLNISTALDTAFASFLERIEVLFLRKVLGVSLYNLFYDGIKADTIEAKWSNLFNGCDFVSGSDTYHFDGLKRALIDYSFVTYIQDKTTTNVTSGNVATKQNNADSLTPIGKLIDAQNECLDLIDDLDVFISLFESDYPNFIKGMPFPQRANIFGI